MKREDGSSLLRPEIAGGKAWGALGMGFGGREFARRAAANPAFVQALSVASGGKIVPVPGGVLIRDKADEIIGAVGISGDTSDNDETCAVFGIDWPGLLPTPAIPASARREHRGRRYSPRRTIATEPPDKSSGKHDLGIR